MWAAVMCGLRMSQNPTQPKGIGDPCEGVVHLFPPQVVSQNPTQPKGIGDPLRAKPLFSSLRLKSQNPTQPKGIGDHPVMLPCWSLTSLGHKTPPSRKALETWQWPSMHVHSECTESQNPTQPKGIGDSARNLPMSSSAVESQNPTQPKGIGDRPRFRRCPTRTHVVTKPHPAERHWRPCDACYGFDLSYVVSQNPTQPKGIGDCAALVWLHLGKFIVTKPHPAERHWRPARVH